MAALLPPVVTILSPEAGTTVKRARVTIKYTLRSPSGAPVTALRVLIDGRSLRKFDRDVIRVEGEEYIGKLHITVPNRDVEISLLAENEHSVSEPSSVRLIWGGPLSALVY